MLETVFDRISEYRLLSSLPRKILVWTASMLFVIKLCAAVTHSHVGADAKGLQYIGSFSFVVFFFSRACWHVSANVFVISGVTLEKHLRGWTSVVGAPSIMLKPRTDGSLAERSLEEHHVGQRPRYG